MAEAPKPALKPALKPAPKPPLNDSTPTAAENERIKKEEADAKQDRDNEKGAKSGSTTREGMKDIFAKGGSIRGGGIEQRGKTKGRMV